MLGRVLMRRGYGARHRAWLLRVLHRMLYGVLLGMLLRHGPWLHRVRLLGTLLRHCSWLYWMLLWLLGMLLRCWVRLLGCCMSRL
jgi:hypothetical protein